MKKFSSFIITLMLSAGMYSFAQEKQMVMIPMESGERWWGMDDEGRVWDCYMDKSRFRNSFPFRHIPTFFETRMLVSSAGRYLWSAEPIAVRLAEDKLFVESSGEKPEVHKAGKTLREAYLMCIHKNLSAARCTPAPELLTHIVYRPSNRPDITWGQEEIMEYARKIIAEGLPSGIIVIPEGWCSINTLFSFSHELFPDPHGMIAELHKMGFKVMLTVIPRTPNVGRVYTDAYRNGYIISQQGLFRKHLSRVFDIGDDAFFASYRRDFDAFRTKYPFDGYRLECSYASEYASDDPFMLNWEKLAEGIEMCEMTGTYKRPFSSYVSDIDEPLNGHTEGFMFGNLFAASLSGDIYKTTNCSVPYLRTEEDKAAYMIASLFFPVASVDFVPWEFTDRRFYDRVKAALTFRASLADYMDNLLKESVRTGEPIVRHMEYQFPRQGFTDCDGQFMLGPKYLIVPCLGGGSKCMVRLPKGRWADRDGNRFKGPLVMDVDCTGGVVYFELLK